MNRRPAPNREGQAVYFFNIDPLGLVRAVDPEREIDRLCEAWRLREPVGQHVPDDVLREIMRTAREVLKARERGT
jgi:hypothetical protein